MTVGRNLAVGGSKYVESGDNLAATYYVSPTEGGALSNGYGYLVAGETYTITICVTPAEGTTHFCLFMSSGMANQCDIYVSGHEIQTVSATFKATYSDGRTPVDAAYYAQCQLYRHPNPLPDPGVNDLQIHWIKIEKGSEFTGWSPAPEDVVNNSDMLIDVEPLSDYIMAKGRSGKWSYIKYVNGFAMCWGQWVLTDEYYTEAFPSGLIYGHMIKFDFPFTFYEKPIVVPTGTVGTGVTFSVTFDTNLTWAKVLLAANDTSSTCYVWIIVQGLWKNLT